MSKFETWTDALADFQATVPPIGKNKRAETGKFGYEYADLSEIVAVIREPLAERGFAFTQSLLYQDSRDVLCTSLWWRGDPVDRSFMPLNLALPPQQVGSLLTYMRRYCLLALLGLQPVGEDDDAVAAQATYKPQRPAPRREPLVDQGAFAELTELGKARGLDDTQLASVAKWASRERTSELAQLTQREAESVISSWKAQLAKQQETVYSAQDQLPVDAEVA